MAAIINNSVKDMWNLEIVPVIASFDATGHVRPLYVRLRTESFKVVSSWVEYGFVNSCTYHCELLVEDALRPIELTYYFTEKVWAIPKNTV